MPLLFVNTFDDIIHENGSKTKQHLYNRKLQKIMLCAINNFNVIIVEKVNNYAHWILRFAYYSLYQDTLYYQTKQMSLLHRIPTSA